MQDSDSSSNDIIMILVAIIVILLGIGFWYSAHAGNINYLILLFNKAHLMVFSFLPGEMGRNAQYLCTRINEVNPNELTITQLMDLTAFTSKYIRWVSVPIILSFAFWGWKSKMIVSECYRQQFDMQSLLEQNVGQFPCVAPIAFRHRSILDEPLDEGSWATARKPLQWAQEHDLLLDEKGEVIPKKDLIDKNGLPNIYSSILKKDNNKKVRLDEKKAEALFVEQLGGKFKKFEDLPDYQRGLVAAFMAFGAADKDTAQDLLDQMSLSFVEPVDPSNEFEIDITGADEIIKKHKDNESFAFFTDTHKTYVYPYIMSMLEDYARQKGVLATSQFIWLRPVNRTLWYALNQMGGREAWIEAAGAWAHYHCEKLVSESLEAPEVKTALAGLKTALQNKGWLARKGKDKYVI